MEVSKLKDQGLLFKDKNANFVLNPLLKDGRINADAANSDFALSSEPEQDIQNQYEYYIIQYISDKIF
jgi:hypothetical protein